FFFFFSSRRRHTRSLRDWSSDVCSSDLPFVGETANESLLLLQAFVSVVTVTILTMAALVAERRDAEARLRTAHATLERRVGERTGELERLNEVLQGEIGERTRTVEALRTAETRFRALLEFAPDAMVIANQ